MVFENRNLDIYNKIELLCFGLNDNSTVEEVYDYQNPFDLTRTGNVGLQLLVGKNRIPANVPVFNQFTKESTFFLRKNNSSYHIEETVTGRIIPVDVLKRPIWYNTTVGNERYAGQYLLKEGKSTLICSISDSCGYVMSGAQCKFCAIGSNSIHNFKESSEDRKQNIIKSILCALNSGDSEISSINLTGGNTLSKDNGAKRYLDYIKAIRKVSDIPICLEMSPPEDVSSFDCLIEAGVNAFMLNIEIWDPKIRKLIMPGKSHISRDRYKSAWRYLSDVLGKGNLSSVVIVGFESKTSVKEAINEMTQLGVMPSIMPFRPNDGAELENYTTVSPDVVYELTRYAYDMARKYDIDPTHIPGCAGCGACAAENDFWVLS